MKKISQSARYSAVGVFLSGILTAIIGCSAEDQLRALLLFLALLLSGGGESMEDTTSAPTFSSGTTLSFNQAFGENTTSCADGDSDNFSGQDRTFLDLDPAGSNVTVTAFRSCRTATGDNVFQIVVLTGTPPNLTLKDRTETITVTDADCPVGTMCIVHFNPGLPVSATDYVGLYTPLGGVFRNRAVDIVGSLGRIAGDPSGTNSYTTEKPQYLWDFGTQ